jgi:hypothetical protein
MSPGSQGGRTHLALVVKRHCGDYHLGMARREPYSLSRPRGAPSRAHPRPRCTHACRMGSHRDGPCSLPPRTASSGWGIILYLSQPRRQTEKTAKGPKRAKEPAVLPHQCLSPRAASSLVCSIPTGRRMLHASLSSQQACFQRRVHAKSECIRFVHSCGAPGLCFGSDALDSSGDFRLLVEP